MGTIEERGRHPDTGEVTSVLAGSSCNCSVKSRDGDLSSQLSTVVLDTLGAQTP